MRVYLQKKDYYFKKQGVEVESPLYHYLLPGLLEKVLLCPTTAYYRFQYPALFQKTFPPKRRLNFELHTVIVTDFILCQGNIKQGSELLFWRAELSLVIKRK